MKKYFLFIFLISLIFPQSEKLAVSILDFNGEDVSPKVLKACFQRLETSLIESDKFIVIEKSEREEILKEQKIQSSGICDTDCIVDIGQLLGAEYLMLGEIIDLSGLYQIDIKIINVEKGDVTEKVTKEVEGSVKDLLNAMESAANDIVRRLSFNRSSFSQLVVDKQEKLDEQEYGFINVISEPNNAIVLIDNVKEGVTPLKNKRLKVGSRNLKIIKTGYVTINKGVRITETDTIRLEEIMSYKTGSLNISSDPQGSKIYINNDFKGISPLKIPEVLIGKLVIEATYPNYLDGMKNVIIEYDKTTDLSMKLIPKPGSINVVLNVKNAIIECNGEIFKADTSGFTTINNLIPGNYEVMISKAGYINERRNVAILPNKTEAIEVEMYLNDKVKNNSFNMEYDNKNYDFLKKKSFWVKKSSGKRYGENLVIIENNLNVMEFPLDNSAVAGYISTDTYKIISEAGEYVELEIPSDKFFFKDNQSLPDNLKYNLFEKTFNSIFLLVTIIFLFSELS